MHTYVNILFVFPITLHIIISTDELYAKANIFNGCILFSRMSLLLSENNQPSYVNIVPDMSFA